MAVSGPRPESMLDDEVRSPLAPELAAEKIEGRWQATSFAEIE